MYTMEKTGMLRHVYDVYEDWARQFSLACIKGCASCCTQSVTMTTLEGGVITSYLKRRGRLPELESALVKTNPVAAPARTTNQFAKDCLSRKEPDSADPEPWNLSPCIFLRESCCSIYPVRPFGCRSFGSTSPCAENGAAEMPSLMITINTVAMQIIEHLDSEAGRWGNMMEILKDLIGCRATESEDRPPLCQANPGFLVEPAEEDAVHAFLDSLSKPSSKEKAQGSKCAPGGREDPV